VPDGVCFADFSAVFEVDRGGFGVAQISC
jgi:hypothetical protein